MTQKNININAFNKDKFTKHEINRIVSYMSLLLDPKIRTQPFIMLEWDIPDKFTEKGKLNIFIQNGQE